MQPVCRITVIAIHSEGSTRIESSKPAVFSDYLALTHDFSSYSLRFIF